MSAPHDRAEVASWVDRTRARGQVIILFALFLTAMLGVLGLALDLGFAFSQRRTMQNTADAAALAGARAVARWSPSNNIAALPEVQAMTANPDNRLGSSSPTIVSCTYVDYGSATGGGGDDGDDDDDDDGGGGGSACGATVPAWAKGVRVVVEEEHETFFIQAIPGAPERVATRATATAVVQLADPIKDGPFIVCGTAAWAVRNRTSALNPHQSVPLLKSDNTIDQQYVGWTFRVWDNSLSQGQADKPPAKAGCTTPAADWNGSAGDEGAANINRPTPGYFSYDHGTGAGQVNSTIIGAQGCVAGTEKPYKCVMILPLARSTPAPTNTELWVVGFAAFYVESVDPNSVNGVLLSNYILNHRGSDTWCRDCEGTVVVRLRE
jgi:Putative Flp pilus-assembly TadE/G-like